MASLVEPRYLIQGGPSVLTRSLSRLLRHLGFEDISLIDGPGDRGADVLARRNDEQWVFQSKWKLHPADLIDDSAIKEVLNARDYYGASRAAIVTNARASKKLIDKQAALRLAELDVHLWDGNNLLILAKGAKPNAGKVALHEYQRDALARVERDLDTSGRSLLVMATGLGKTFVAGEVVARALQRKSNARVLVVAHTQDLSEQLERALWTHIDLQVRTQLAMSGVAFDDYPGVTCATLPTALRLVRQGYQPDLLVIDEAHHVGETGQYADLISLLGETRVLGVTATPWRGDGFDIATTLGRPSAKVGIEDGMRLGYLAQVRYRLFADNIDWDFVRAASRHGYSIGDLNARLFLPGRDDAILDELAPTWAATPAPRGIVFCRTIEHAERMSALLQTRPEWKRATPLHAGLGKRERQMRLLHFRSGEIPILTAVDVLNEGVDVPDVNILCFARVTHSRRIFIQQLGRGLRVREGKSQVEVLDFVSDLRRVAEVLALRRASGAADLETIERASRNRIGFADQAVGPLLDEWIKDAADLATRADEYRLQFPDAGRFRHPS